MLLASAFLSLIPPPAIQMIGAGFKQLQHLGHDQGGDHPGLLAMNTRTPMGQQSFATRLASGPARPMARVKRLRLVADPIKPTSQNHHAPGQHHSSTPEVPVPRMSFRARRVVLGQARSEPTRERPVLIEGNSRQAGYGSWTSPTLI